MTKRSLVVFAVLAAACGSTPLVVVGDAGQAAADASVATDAGVHDGGSAVVVDAGSAVVDSGTTVVDAGPPSFRVDSPVIDTDGGVDFVWCYAFHTSNTEAVSVKTWQATLPTHAVSASLFLTDTDFAAPGTISRDTCGFSTQSWAFTAWQGQTTWAFPADDGAGKPVGTVISAGHSAVLMVHMKEAPADDTSQTVRIEGLGYPRGTTITNAEPYVAYNGSFSVPSNNTPTIVTQSCTVPTGAKFNWLSVYTFKHSTETTIKDDQTTVFDGTVWDMPGAQVTTASPFTTFASSNKATFACTYVSSSGSTIHPGDSVNTDENCVMLSYTFPATKASMCVNGIVIQ